MINIQPNEAKKYREMLASRYGINDPDKIPFTDIVIEKLNNDALDFFNDHDWKSYQNNRELCIHYLIGEKELKKALPFLFEFIYLFHYNHQNSNKITPLNTTQILFIEEIIKETHSDINADFKKYMRSCKLQQVLNLNPNDAAIEHLKIYSTNDSPNLSGTSPQQTSKPSPESNKKELFCQQCGAKMHKQTLTRGNYIGIIKAGSSAKSVGGRWLFKFTKLVIERYLKAVQCFKAVCLFDSEFCLVI